MLLHDEVAKLYAQSLHNSSWLSWGKLQVADLPATLFCLGLFADLDQVNMLIAQLYLELVSYF
jgi:hypothetical protein